MRLVTLPLAVVVLAGCAEAPGVDENCGYPELDRTVLVLERGEQTASLARLSGGCLSEAPADIVLGFDQNLLAAHDQPFVGVNDAGALFRVDAAALALRTPAIDVYADIPEAERGVHGIYGVDVDAAGDLWISRGDIGTLAIVKPNGALDAVDLSDLDPDGVPDMNGVLVQDGKAFVALGFLPARDGEDFGDNAKRRGAIAVIDTATRARVAVLDLAGKNPVHALVPTGDPGVVVVATAGRHDEVSDTDGIDRVWLDGSRPAELLVKETEPELHASVEEVVWGGEHEVYAITLGPEPGLNPTKLVAFDPSEPAGKREIRVLAQAPWFDDPVNGAAYVHAGLAITADHVLVGDHTPGAPMIRVFSRATGQEVAQIPTKVGAPWALLALPR